MTMPHDAHQNYLIAELGKEVVELDKPFYLDTWPFGWPLLVVTSPNMANQACQDLDLDKPQLLERFFQPFAGGVNIFTMNGREWKNLRSIFTPGFSASYVLAEMDLVVRETTDLVEIMREHAHKGDILSLDDVLLNFIMDVIGSVSLNSRFRSQRQFNVSASSMRDQIRWRCSDYEFKPFNRWNPVRTFVQWNNSCKMNENIPMVLD